MFFICQEFSVVKTCFLTDMGYITLIWWYSEILWVWCQGCWLPAVLSVTLSKHAKAKHVANSQMSFLDKCQAKTTSYVQIVNIVSRLILILILSRNFSIELYILIWYSLTFSSYYATSFTGIRIGKLKKNGIRREREREKRFQAHLH